MRTERYSALFINRRDAYCEQQDDGSYLSRRREVTEEVVAAHLRGRITCAWYAINLLGRIKWACVDADSADGITVLQTVHRRLADLGLPAHIEASREGRGHLWLFLQPIEPRPVRMVLKRVSGKDTEVFPKQDRIGRRGLGSAVRGPLGVHRRTGVRYGYLDPATLTKVGKTLREELNYLATVHVAQGSEVAEAMAEVLSSRRREPIQPRDPEVSVVEIARLFTELEARGHYYVGLCPLHPESQPSFAVYPNPGGVGRWHCFHEDRGGDAVSLYAEIKGLTYRRARAELSTRTLPQDQWVAPVGETTLARGERDDSEDPGPRTDAQ